jgi:hypothetical protein
MREGKLGTIEFARIPGNLITRGKQKLELLLGYGKIPSVRSLI